MARVLVIDDQANVRRSISTALKLEGHDVTTAESVAEAIKLMETTRFHAVIIDMILPAGDSLPFITQLKENRPETLIVAISGDQEILESASRADFAIPKPLDMTSVNGVLKDLV